MTEKVILRTEAEWKVQGRFVKQKAVPVMRHQVSGMPLFAKFQTFTNGEHPYHVPNYIGGNDDSTQR